MASSYYSAPYDDLGTEEEQLVDDKDEYTTRLPNQARKSSSLVSWLARVALVISMAVNMWLWVSRTRASRVDTHQMFCMCSSELGDSSCGFTDIMNTSPSNSSDCIRRCCHDKWLWPRYISIHGETDTREGQTLA